METRPFKLRKVTVSLPRDAANRLRLLAQRGDNALIELGILSVQLEGDEAISLMLEPSMPLGDIVTPSDEPISTSETPPTFASFDDVPITHATSANQTSCMTSLINAPSESVPYNTNCDIQMPQIEPSDTPDLLSINDNEFCSLLHFDTNKSLRLNNDHHHHHNHHNHNHNHNHHQNSMSLLELDDTSLLHSTDFHAADFMTIDGLNDEIANEYDYH